MYEAMENCCAETTMRRLCWGVLKVVRPVDMHLIAFDGYKNDAAVKWMH